MALEEDDGHRARIAERLRQAREYVGLSQDDVAKALGMSRANIDGIECNLRIAEITELELLARLYRSTVEFLSTGREPAPDGPEQLAFLARAIKGLSQRDINEVARFTEFLKNAPKTDCKE